MPALEVIEPLWARVSTLTLPQIFLCVFGLVFIYVLLVKVIYNLFFHPLSSYPGPKLWAISRLPWNYVNFKGRLGWRIREMHQKYGPVVRIAPDELSYTTSTAWKKIYGQRSPEFEKALDGRGFAPVTINGHRALLTETTEGHERLRRAINPAFSERAVREQEGYLQGHSNTLIQQLMKKSKEGVAADMTRWLSLITFDILNDLAFGAPSGYLTDADSPHITVMMNRSRSIVFFQFAMQYGLVPILNMITPKYVAEARRKHLALTAAKVEARLQAKDPGKDFMSYILNNEAERLSNLDLVLLASTFIVAGSNTSADAMTGLTYLLLRNPEKLDKLRHEIRSTFKSKEDITVLATARCKYLSACIEEGLRLYPPTPCNLPRVVPGKGEVIDGKWVPGGMAVSVHVLSAGHSERNFTRAMEFIPERYMELLPGSEFEGDDKAGIQPFSYGPRNCAGKTLAFAEMRLTIAKIMWHFDLQLEKPEEDWWNSLGTYLVWEKKPLMIRLHARTDI